MTCIAAIPIYKNLKDLTQNEILSLEQVFRIFKNYRISFIGPPGIAWKAYKEFAGAKNSEGLVEIFDEKYFKDVTGYNSLLLNINFYKRFGNYRFILIYQLDAYVFADSLANWCHKSFDFIGAPWFEGWHNATEASKITGVGNGGFSLRNIPSSKRMLRRLHLLRKWQVFTKPYKREHKENLKEGIFKRLFKIKNIEYLPQLLNGESANEDFTWTQLIAKTFSDFNVAPVEDARKFSFDVNPSLLYKMNHDQLPFGCHAWERYEPEFWKSFIPQVESVESNL